MSLKKILECSKGITEIEFPDQLNFVQEGDKIDVRVMLKNLINSSMKFPILLHQTVISNKKGKIITIHKNVNDLLFEGIYKINQQGELIYINNKIISKMNPKYYSYIWKIN